jgi:hypothetical protein
MKHPKTLIVAPANWEQLENEFWIQPGDKYAFYCYFTHAGTHDINIYLPLLYSTILSVIQTIEH